MRKLGGMLFAVAMGASLVTGCSQGSGAMSAIDVDAKSIEAHVTKLAGETFKGTATAAVDFASLRDALPEELAMSWGNLSFDAAANATVVTDLKLTPKEMTTVGISVSELRLYDLDVDLLKTRLAGGRLTDTAPLARRIDAKGVSLFGLADTINQLQGGMYDSFGDTFPDTFPDDFPQPAPEQVNPLKFQPGEPVTPEVIEPAPGDEFDFDSFQPAVSIERYDVSIGRVIFDDIVLKPYQVAPATLVDPNNYSSFDALMPVLQQLAAISQAYGIDTAAYLDMKFGFAVTEYGQKMAGDINIAAIGARGLRGGDMDGMFMRDMKYVASGDIAPGAPPFTFDYNVGLMSAKDFRLGKVFDYFAKGAFPPKTEANLMSLGTWRSEKESMKMGGKEIYAVAETSFDGTGFHWFIPTKLQATGKGVSIDVGAFLDMAAQMGAAAQTAEGMVDDGSLAQLQQVRGLLDKHGLSRPTFNSNFGWNWNANNGDAVLSLGFDGDSLLNVNAKYEGGFPSFKAVADLVPENPEETNMAAINNVFMTGTTLKLVELNVQDKGGLPKIYGIIGEFAPVSGMSPNPMSAEDVRLLAANAVESMAIMAGQQIPEVPALLTPVANFLKSGGKLRFAMQPSKPTRITDLGMSMMGAQMGAASPSQVIKDLGLKAEHSK